MNRGGSNLRLHLRNYFSRVYKSTMYAGIYDKKNDSHQTEFKLYRLKMKPSEISKFLLINYSTSLSYFSLVEKST